MKLSIISVVYNNAQYIEDCIKSVASQSYRNYEHIVVDGGSTDGTVGLIEKHRERISKWISEPDDGLYFAMNKGISMATGDVIGFLHSDDFYADQDVIEKVADVFINSDVESLYGDLVYISKNGEKIIRYWKSGNYRKSMVKWGWMPPHPTFFVKREVYNRHGCFNTNLRVAADYDLILRFLGKHGISTHYIPEVLIKMRIGGNSNKSIKNIIRKSKEDYWAMKENGLPVPIAALLYKNFSKLRQFIIK
ncbi:MAG: glycosyltransferase [Candidatus Dadabacteria bacterium]|nr:glycosyltransferase [Candidatus Dadabacteria bacterium]